MLRDRLRQIVEETETPAARAFDIAVQVLIVGLGVVAVPPAILASTLTKVREDSARGNDPPEHD